VLENFTPPPEPEPSNPSPMDAADRNAGPGALLEKYPWARRMKEAMGGFGSGHAPTARGNTGFTGPGASGTEDKRKSGGAHAGRCSACGRNLAAGRPCECSALLSIVTDPATKPSWGLALVVAKFGGRAHKRAWKARGWQEWLRKNGEKNGPMAAVLLPGWCGGGSEGQPTKG
jgi:hypothetical protein